MSAPTPKMIRLMLQVKASDGEYSSKVKCKLFYKVEDNTQNTLLAEPQGGWNWLEEFANRCYERGKRDAKTEN